MVEDVRRLGVLLCKRMIHAARPIVGRRTRHLEPSTGVDPLNFACYANMSLMVPRFLGRIGARYSSKVLSTIMTGICSHEAAGL